MRPKETSQLYYVVFFVCFGLIPALMSGVVFYRLSAVAEEGRIARRAEEVMAAKISAVADYKQGLEHIVASLRDNILLTRYLNEPSTENLVNLQQLFYGISNANRELMQARFIDSKGMERIRVDLSSDQEKPFIVASDALQQNAQRYYFQEARKIEPATFWYSMLELHIIHGQIEKPIKSVLKVASPVSVDGQEAGIVIINVHASNFLEKLVHNQLFNIMLVDQDGYFIAATDETLSWSRYLKTGNTFQSRYPEVWPKLQKVLDREKVKQVGEFFTADLSTHLKKDRALLILNVRAEAREIIQKKRVKAVVFVIAMIVLFSLPLSWLISRGPVRLYAQFKNKNRELEKTLQLVDSYIAHFTVDENGRVISGSTAFFDLLHVSPGAVEGRNEIEIQCKKDSTSTLQDFLLTLKEGEQWHGEMHFSKRDESCFWADAIASPMLDAEGDCKRYSVICRDITDKKRVEQLSIIDKLTGLFNRRHFDTIFFDEFGRALREQRRLSFAKLDVDHFKKYNDNYGHQKGDLVLQRVAEAISGRLRRPGDFCFRLGGEEFGIVFLDQFPSEAAKFVDSIRQTVADLCLEHKWSETLQVVTVSIGLVTAVPDRDIDAEGLYRLADDALSRAKAAGRNCVEESSYSVTSLIG